MNQPRSPKKTDRKMITRFTFGSVLGLSIAMVLWSFSIYFQAALSPVYSIVGVFLVAISFGAIASIISVDRLMDLLDHFPPL